MVLIFLIIYDNLLRYDIIYGGYRPMVGHRFVVPRTWVQFPVVAQENAPVVKWISHLASDQAFQVRVLARAHQYRQK